MMKDFLSLSNKSKVKNISLFKSIDARVRIKTDKVVIHIIIFMNFYSILRSTYQGVELSG